MKSSDYIAKFLHANGMTTVFEVAGGYILHLLDSLRAHGGFEIVSCHHEQAAAFAAEGWARMSGKCGVAMATSGPGATNLLTGIASCYFDSTPCLFITGAVNRAEALKISQNIRQSGFQGCDIVGMAMPVCKDFSGVMGPFGLPTTLERLRTKAMAHRRGPVLLDIPNELQAAEIDEPTIDATIDAWGRANLELKKPIDTTALRADLAKAKRPLILAGGGIRSGVCAGAFRKFVERVNVPVVHSLMGVDLLPYEHHLRVGMIGTYGNRWANMALAEADFVLVLGSRLDVRQTGSETEAFTKGKTIYHVDCSAGEMNNRVKGCVAIEAELGDFFEAVKDIESWDLYAGPLRGLLLQGPTSKEWWHSIRVRRNLQPDEKENVTTGINPNTFMHALSQQCKHAAAYVVGVGQHQMWAAQSLELVEGQRFLTSGGMGAMGWALPAAIGAWFACGKKPVVCIVGDGDMQMNIQELQTIVHHELPIKIVVMNNQALGMVKQTQDERFGGRAQSTVDGYSAPNFTGIARAYGLETSWTKSDPASSLSFMAATAKAFLLEVMLPISTNAYPKVPFGKPLSEMEPVK